MALQRADIIGLQKLIKHIEGYEFCRVEIKRGANTIFVKTGENNEATEELIEAVEDWAKDLLDSDPNNATMYRLGLSGKNNPEKPGHGTKFLHVDFRLNDPSQAWETRGKQSSVGGDVYLELGELRAINQQLTAENERLQMRIDELEALEDDDDDEPEQSTDMLGAVIEQFKPQLPALIGALVNKLLNNGTEQQTNAMPLSGITDMEEIIEKLKKHDPQLEAHLAKLLTIAESNPAQFKMLLNMLGT